MSFGRNPLSAFVPDHSPSSDQTTPRQYGYGWSQQSQSPIHTETSMSSSLCYSAGSPRDQSEQPQYSELYERLVAEARHQSLHNKNDDPSSRDQCGSGIRPYAVSPLSTNAYRSDPEGRYDSGCPAEDIYEYDGDAILQQYSDLSSLHSNEGYTDTQSYTHPIKHSAVSNVHYDPSRYAPVPLLYQGLTEEGSCDPDKNSEHIEQDSTARYSPSPPAYHQLYTETPSDPTHGGIEYISTAPINTYDITHHATCPSHPQSQHHPVPTSRHSSYSELSANVAFILGMASQTTAKVPKQASPKGTPTSPTRASVYRYPNAAGFIPPEPQITYRSVGGSPSSRGSKSIVGKDSEHIDISPPTTPTTPTQNDYLAKRNPLRRRPSLACFFCRERKIACGRPAEGSSDPTCKCVVSSVYDANTIDDPISQCARRSFKCDYPTESLRGQHRRGRKKVHSYSVERAA